MAKNTLKLWTDGTRQAVLSNYRTKSANRKTGDMSQLSILTEDIKPTEAIKTRQDGLICGDCPLRHGKGCYVNPMANNAQWRAVQGADVSPFPSLDHHERDCVLALMAIPHLFPLTRWTRGLVASPIGRDTPTRGTRWTRTTPVSLWRLLMG